MSAPSLPSGRLDQVEKRTFLIRDFVLENGVVMPEVTIAYELYGALDPGRRNAVLMTHGYTGSQHVAGTYPGETTSGPWNSLIGPGKAIDTDKLLVVSSNMLGSSFGSSNASFIEPATGKPYGSRYPDIGLADIVRAQRLLLDHLGVEHLVAVAGASFGGYQAFQWAVSYPDFVDGIVAVATAPKGRGGSADVDRLVARLAQDRNWNGGDYYDRGGVIDTTTAMRVDTLLSYGIEAQLAGAFPEPVALAAEIERQARAWARQFDANSLVILRRAAVRFDAVKDFARVKAKVLYVLLTSDVLFPPAIAPDVMARLAAAGIDASYVEVETDFGHSGYGRASAGWEAPLRAFMQRLVA
ncbi:MAG: alpha/beta fold hydrolase [Hyphomicrobiaceae bacterium]|nr:alpha/beta fold hydrolase [Hyphomicrobiaceae bacterium]